MIFCFFLECKYFLNLFFEFIFFVIDLKCLLRFCLVDMIVSLIKVNVGGLEKDGNICGYFLFFLLKVFKWKFGRIVLNCL